MCTRGGKHCLGYNYHPSVKTGGRVESKLCRERENMKEHSKEEKGRAEVRGALKEVSGATRVRYEKGGGGPWKSLQEREVV